eukprot:358902-Chlamydomonas_euryale.AAC.1
MLGESTGVSGAQSLRPSTCVRTGAGRRLHTTKVWRRRDAKKEVAGAGEGGRGQHRLFVRRQRSGTNRKLPAFPLPAGCIHYCVPASLPPRPRDAVAQAALVLRTLPSLVLRTLPSLVLRTLPWCCAPSPP